MTAGNPASDQAYRVKPPIRPRLAKRGQQRLPDVAHRDEAEIDGERAGERRRVR